MCICFSEIFPFIKLLSFFPSIVSSETSPRSAAIVLSDDRQYDVLRDRYQGLARETYGPCSQNFCP